MLDSKLVINKGLRLVDLTTRRDFIVLCSCPNSRPRRHTSSYVRQHRDEFVTMADWQASEAKVMAQLAQTAEQVAVNERDAYRNRLRAGERFDFSKYGLADFVKMTPILCHTDSTKEASRMTQLHYVKSDGPELNHWVIKTGAAFLMLSEEEKVKQIYAFLAQVYPTGNDKDEHATWQRITAAKQIMLIFQKPAEMHKDKVNMEQALANADGTPWQARQNRSTIAQQADGNPPKETTDPSAAGPAHSIPDQENTNVPTTDSSGPET